MEEKKLDKSSLIGMILISILLAWFLLTNKSNENQKSDQKTNKEQISQNNTSNSASAQPSAASLGAFAFGAANASDKEIVLSNNLLNIKFSTKGGYVSLVEVKNQYQAKEHDSKKLVQLIANNNSNLNLKIQTRDNRILNTKDLFFEPSVSKSGENQIVSMKLKTSETAFLEYRYVIKPNDYMFDFSIRSVGLSTVLNTSEPAELQWNLKAISNEKSITYENRYSEVIFDYDNGKDDYLNATKSFTEDSVEDVAYVAFKQHLFTSVLLTDNRFKSVKVSSENLVKDETKDTEFTKNFNATFPLEFKAEELNTSMNLYFGPADYNILNKYNKNLDEIVPLGWGIFGWINQWIFVPLFTLLTTFIPHGIAIIIFTVVVRLIMSPIQYKSYVSQAKMKVIRPEVQEISEKFKKDPMKKQQETMKLYQKAGVNPMAGCLPMFLQIPVFYALFQFFPSAFDLRQKSFLWAEDLSSYDSILRLPFHIPFYGNHVSLFPILAGLATFVYMKMTTSDQAAIAQPQEGMPDMSKLMKIMVYISPIMMMFFFNNYASGLSLYYFISNAITIGIMYVIKNKIVTEEKVKAIIDSNKSKERPKSRFQRKMDQMMEQAAQQRQNSNKK